MEKKPFLTLEQVKEIAKTYPTPFHIYDEKGIRENAEKLKKAFSWNKGFREYFAVKATPNPFLINILKEYGFGVDCSSMTELVMAEKMGFGSDQMTDGIMFSSNATPAEEFVYARKLGAIINLDDFTMVDFLEKTAGLPEKDSPYIPGQEVKNSKFFNRFSDIQMQVVLFWLVGMLTYLQRNFPKVFKKGNPKKQQQVNPFEVYTRITANLEKYLNGVNEEQINNETYTAVLTHLNDMMEEHERMERRKG